MGIIIFFVVLFFIVAFVLIVLGVPSEAIIPLAIVGAIVIFILIVYSSSKDNTDKSSSNQQKPNSYLSTSSTKIQTNNIINKQENMCIAIFLANGGNGRMLPRRVKKGNFFNLPKCGFIPPDGYVFKCWLIGNKELNEGAVYYSLDNRVEIKALWKKNESVSTNDIEDNKNESIVIDEEQKSVNNFEENQKVEIPVRIIVRELTLQLSGVFLGDRQTNIKQLTTGDKLNLVVRENDPFDKNTVEVFYSDKSIGLIPKNESVDIKKAITKLKHSFEVTVEEISGGDYVEVRNISVRLVEFNI